LHSDKVSVALDPSCVHGGGVPAEEHGSSRERRTPDALGGGGLSINSQTRPLHTNGENQTTRKGTTLPAAQGGLLASSGFEPPAPLPSRTIFTCRVKTCEPKRSRAERDRERQPKSPSIHPKAVTRLHRAPSVVGVDPLAPLQLNLAPG